MTHYPGHDPDCDNDDFCEAEFCPSTCTVPSGRDDPESISNLMAAGPPPASAFHPSGLKRYRPRGAAVEAVQLTRENFDAVGEWAGVVDCWGLDAPFPALHIETPRGLEKAGLGSYVIRGVTGVFFSMSANNFTAVYQEVTDVD